MPPAGNWLLYLLFLISRNSPQQLGMVSPELSVLVDYVDNPGIGGWAFFHQDSYILSVSPRWWGPPRGGRHPRGLNRPAGRGLGELISVYQN